MVYLGGAHRVYDLPQEEQLDTMAWMLARRRDEVAFEGVGPSIARDSIHLLNRRAKGKRKGRGSPELDAFDAWSQRGGS